MARKIRNQTNAYDMYLEMCEYTESPLLYHRWSFISTVGAAIGRNLYIPFGDSMVYPNQMIVLLGSPGARKSSAIKIASKILEDSGYEFFVSGSTSKEKFLQDLAFGFDKISRGIEPNSKAANMDDDIFEEAFDNRKDNKRVSQAYVNASELETFFGGNGSSFIPTLTDLWDNKDHYADRFKNSNSVWIPNPTVNLIGGATPTTFARIFNADIVGTGMLSRMILVHGKGQRLRITLPQPVLPEIREVIVQLLHEIRTGLSGPMKFTEEALHALDIVYQSYEDLPDSRLQYYGTRRLEHLLKLCIITAALDLETTITLEHLILANTILSYTELYMPRALGEFGKSKNSDTVQKILDTIINHEVTGGIGLLDLFTITGQDVDSAHELSAICKKLQDSNKIYVKDQKFIPVKKVVRTSDPYVDYSLLWEYKLKEADALETETITKALLEIA